MTVFHKELLLESNGRRVTYHAIKEPVQAAVKESGIQDGICVVSSQHTTCSVIFEEFMHDFDFNGDEYLQVDLNEVLEKVVPRQTSDHQYRYPGPEHTAFAMDLVDSDYPAEKSTLLNADAHIRASLFGASETFIVKAGELLIGTVGAIYFVDWDQNRVRTRHCHVLVMGE